LNCTHPIYSSNTKLFHCHHAQPCPITKKFHCNKNSNSLQSENHKHFGQLKKQFSKTPCPCSRNSHFTLSYQHTSLTSIPKTRKKLTPYTQLTPNPQKRNSSVNTSPTQQTSIPHNQLPHLPHSLLPTLSYNPQGITACTN
jgi:hypothetical protein